MDTSLASRNGVEATSSGFNTTNTVIHLPGMQTQELAVALT
jgi:hypothetical protein